MKNKIQNHPNFLNFVFTLILGVIVAAHSFGSESFDPSPYQEMIKSGTSQQEVLATIAQENRTVTASVVLGHMGIDDAEKVQAAQAFMDQVREENPPVVAPTEEPSAPEPAPAPAAQPKPETQPAPASAVAAVVNRSPKPTQFVGLEELDQSVGVRNAKPDEGQPSEVEFLPSPNQKWAQRGLLIAMRENGPDNFSNFTSPTIGHNAGRRPNAPIPAGYKWIDASDLDYLLPEPPPEEMKADNPGIYQQIQDVRKLIQGKIDAGVRHWGVIPDEVFKNNILPNLPDGGFDENGAI